MITFRPNSLVAVALFILALSLIACVPVTPVADSEGGALVEDPASSAEGALVEDPTSQVEEESRVDLEKPTSNRMVNVAMNDLAQQLGVSIEDIEIVSVENVVWPDSALGCPQPDMMYMQVLMDGMRIRLQVDGAVYQYNSGGAEDPSLCEEPQEPVSAVSVPGF